LQPLIVSWFGWRAVSSSRPYEISALGAGRVKAGPELARGHRAAARSGLDAAKPNAMMARPG